MKAIYYHLPGLFEFYELYRLFIPLFFEHREYFHDWCRIGSVYGSPEGCIWGGGREGIGDAKTEDVLSLLNGYGISGRLTFSNSLLREEHLADRKCNDLCMRFASAVNAENGVIIHSDLLAEHIKKNYPRLYLVSSTTKALTDFNDFRCELLRPDFRYAVPDFRLNKSFKDLAALSDLQKKKVEFLCNECCSFGCLDRKQCYEEVSRKVLGENSSGFTCRCKDAKDGYLFSKAMENPGFIGPGDILNTYMPMGFSNFKLEGRGLGSALVLEILIFYMVKPEYQIHVREKIYLSNMLDLF